MFYSFIKAIATVLLKILFFAGRKNSKSVNEEMPDCGFIVAANHISMLDPFFIACAMKRQVHYMAKAELFGNKLLAAFLKGINAFPVDRSRADINAVKTSLSILKSGKVLGIFPEGRRVAPNESQSAKLGAVQFAIKTKSPIVPVGVCTKGGVVKLFRKVTVVFGEPIYLNELGYTDTKPETLQKASDLLMEQIRKLAQG